MKRKSSMQDGQEHGGARRKMQAGVLLWVVLALVGAIGLYQRMRTGHDLADYGSYVPWGLWVALYFHGVGIAAGVFLAGGLGYLFGAPSVATRAELRATIVLSLAALLPGLLGVGLDLGRMERGALIYLSPNIGSVMTLNSWLYTLFMLTAVLAWLLSWRKESSWLRPLVAFGAVVCGVFAVGSGLFFAAVHVKPLWHSGIWPVITLVSALSSGAAILLLARCIGAVSSDDAVQDAGCLLARRVLQGGLLVYLGLAAVKWMVAHGYDMAPVPTADPLAVPVLSAAWFQLLLGCFLPLLLLSARRAWGWIAASLLVAAGLFGGRLDLLLKGQPPAELPALPAAFQHARLVFSYRPTVMEWQVGALLLAMGIAIYVGGQMINKTIAARLATAGDGVPR